MDKRRKANQPQKKSGNAEKWLSATVIGSIIAAVGFIIVALINRSTSITTALKPIEATQTAEALHTSIAMITQAYLMRVTNTPTPSLTLTATPSPLATPTSIPLGITNTPELISRTNPALLADIFRQIGDGGDFWFLNDNRSTFYFSASRECSHSGEVGLQITYSIITPDFAGWGVEWNTSPKKQFFDASSFTKLVFWAKGNTGTDPFQISLIDSDKKAFEISLINYRVSISPIDWVKIEIPLSDFKDVNFNSIAQISPGTFYAKNGSGSICLDDISLQ